MKITVGRKRSENWGFTAFIDDILGELPLEAFFLELSDEESPGSIAVTIFLDSEGEHSAYAKGHFEDDPEWFHYMLKKTASFLVSSGLPTGKNLHLYLKVV